MGARLDFLTNMNARGLNREVPLIVPFNLYNPGDEIPVESRSVKVLRRVA